jgi:CheY-like chemotaxis protein
MNMPDPNSKPATIRTVLILDGDALVRMPVVQFLRDCGYRVVEAASTDEAVVILQKTDIPVDVVLSEINIPGAMNGFGFAQWARSVRPELQILLAGTPGRTVQNAAEPCEVGPTLKPYDHKRVLHRIKRLLRMDTLTDGLELARYVRAECPGVSLILASAQAPGGNPSRTPPILNGPPRRRCAFPISKACPSA